MPRAKHCRFTETLSSIVPRRVTSRKLDIPSAQLGLHRGAGRDSNRNTPALCIYLETLIPVLLPVPLPVLVPVQDLTQ